MAPDRYSDDTYLRDNPSWHAEDSEWKAANIAAMIRRNAVPAERIVEVGCGAGVVLEELLRRLGDSASAVGYDVSPQALALAGARSGPRLRFELGEAPACAPGERPFDLLLAVDVIEHVRDPWSFLERLHPVAGRAILHIPLDLSVQTVLRAKPLLRIRNEVGHLHWFTKETALLTLGECGYRVVDWTYTYNLLELQSASRWSRPARLPRRLAYGLNADLGVRLLGGASLLALCDLDGQ